MAVSFFSALTRCLPSPAFAAKVSARYSARRDRLLVIGPKIIFMGVISRENAMSESNNEGSLKPSADDNSGFPTKSDKVNRYTPMVNTLDAMFLIMS